MAVYTVQFTPSFPAPLRRWDRCLSYLREGTGLKPGTKSGPRHFFWFPIVGGASFQRKRERRFPPSAVDALFTQAQFDSMTEAIEI